MGKQTNIWCYNCNCAKSIYGECPHKLQQNDTVFLDDDKIIEVNYYA